MKCKKCGSPLQIDYKVCPYCGTANPHFTAHREEMDKYSKAFESTQKAVISKTKMHTGILVKIAVCAALVLLIVIANILNARIYSLRRGVLRHQATRKIDSYTEKLDIFEEERRYIDFIIWWDEHYVYSVDELENYRPAANVSRYYEALFEEIMRMSDSDYIEYMYSYRSYNDMCNNIAENYCLMLKYSQPADYELNYGDLTQYSGLHAEYMSDALSEARTLIEAAFRLEKGAIDNIDKDSKSRLAVLLMDNWPYEIPSTEEIDE